MLASCEVPACAGTTGSLRAMLPELSEIETIEELFAELEPMGSVNRNMGNTAREASQGSGPAVQLLTVAQCNFGTNVLQIREEPGDEP